MPDNDNLDSETGPANPLKSALERAGFKNLRPADGEVAEIYQSAAKKALALATHDGIDTPFTQAKLVIGDYKAPLPGSELSVDFPRTITVDRGITVVSSEMINAFRDKGGKLDKIALEGMFIHELAGHSVHLGSDNTIDILKKRLHVVEATLPIQAFGIGDGWRAYERADTAFHPVTIDPPEKRRAADAKSPGEPSSKDMLAEIGKKAAAAVSGLVTAGVSIASKGMVSATDRGPNLDEYKESRADWNGARALALAGNEDPKKPIIDALKRIDTYYKNQQDMDLAKIVDIPLMRLSFEKRIKRLEIATLQVASVPISVSAPSLPANPTKTAQTPEQSPNR